MDSGTCQWDVYFLKLSALTLNWTSWALNLSYWNIVHVGIGIQMFLSFDSAHIPIQFLAFIGILDEQ